MLTERTMWGVIPDGFRKITDGRGSRLVVREDRAGEIDFAICRDDRVGAPDYRYQGRSPLEAIRLRDGDTALVRRYRHGGGVSPPYPGFFFFVPPRALS